MYSAEFVKTHHTSITLILKSAYIWLPQFAYCNTLVRLSENMNQL